MNNLRGVSGWLLIFCISLTFVAPVTQVLVAAKAIRNLATARVPIQTLLRLGSVGAIYSGLTILSCMAGVMLWMRKPNAVNVAKAYLVIGAALPIAVFLLMDLAGMHVPLIRTIFNRLVYSVVWYSYLKASRRVKLTYGTS
jgi:CHASE2 domain-containing sensor protein